MIYIKNNTEIQTIFIPRTELQKEAYIASTKTYEDGYKDGFGEGKQYQKDQLLNLYVTENGEYSREDGYGVVTVDIPMGDCSGAYDEGYKEGHYQGKTEGYEMGYNDGLNDCPEGGECNLGEGSILLDTSMAGTYELYASDDGYDGWSKFIVTLENGGAIKVFKAEELIQMFNEGWGIDFGAYYYVGGEITDITEVSVEWGNATYTLDNGFKVYRGDWMNGETFTSEDQIKVGAYIVVYGIIQDYRGTLQFKAHSQVIAYQECEGGEIVTCNLEDKWVTPSMSERDDNGLIVVNPSEGYDGMSRTVIDPQTIYNEGVEEGRNQGGDCPELTTLDVTENGTYEGAFNVVNVDVPQEGGCNLEDKWVTPSMGDRDDNGLIVVEEDEGYDGLDRVVIDPQTIYNEGVEEGKNQGGGSCNIQGSKTIELDGERMGIYPDEGYDGILEVIVEAGRKAEEWREEGRNDIRNKLQSIEITENGRYSVEDQIYVDSLRYNGGYHTDTISTYDINRIEVTFKADTSESISGQGQSFILGGSLWGVNESGEDNACARAIQYAFGRIVGYWEGKWTNAVSTMDGEWLTIILDENGMTVKYPTYENHKDYTYDNGNTNGGNDNFPFIIGGQGRRRDLGDDSYSSSLIEDSQFRGLIKEVKINTNSMGEITYIPKNWGYGVWDRKVENTGEYLSALEPTEGEVTMNGEWEAKYGEGWKEINVNVPSIDGYNYHILTAIGGVVDYGNVPFNVTTFRQKDYNITSFWSDKANAVIENGNLSPNVLVHSLIFGTGHIGAYSFQNMKRLTDITIHPYAIGDYAFANCSNLNRITLYGFSTVVVDYFVSDTAFEGIADKGVVVLYDDFFNNEEAETWVRDVFMSKLPSEWTFEIIKPK